MTTATQSMRPQLERARRAWRASPLPAFLAWWGGELRALLPASMQQALAGGADWHLLERRGDTWHLRRAGESEALAQWSTAASAWHCACLHPPACVARSPCRWRRATTWPR